MFFTLEKLEQRTKELKERRYFAHQTIAPFTAMKGTLSKDEVYHKLPRCIEGESFGLNDFFVGRDGYLWLEKEVNILPKRPGCKVVGLFDFGKTGESFIKSFEALLYVDGKPYQGVDTFHNEVVFTQMEGKKAVLTFLLWTGLEGGGKKKEFYHRMKQADLAYLHKAADELYYFAEAGTRTIRLLPEDSTDRMDLLVALDKAFYLINWDEEAFFETVEEALSCLKKALGRMKKSSEVTVYGIGHTHIDMAWLWRLKHTREKAQRSFSTVLHLMEEYEDYIFLQTQPQLYQYIKQDAPYLYEKIQEKIKENKWEPEGGMWVEADCNLPAGESLVRQLLYGISFFEEEFGKRCEYLWLPDVFGYSWALPQILKQCGIKTFMTSKISWNQYNTMPNDVFWWRGIDGSEILTYFITTPPEGQDMTTGVTYNGLMTPFSVLGSYRKFKNKELSREVLLPYGYGDGGGGVTRDMLEMRRKMDEIPGLPKVKTGKAGEFFERLHKSVENGDRYTATWNGELYLEYHRGTYTSQAYNKKMNRYMENLLLEAEELCALSCLLGKPYEREAFHEAWQCVLLHQFHDIIPGSSIHEVYEDSRVNYEQVRAKVLALKQKALEAITRQKENCYTVYSSCSFPGTEQIYIKTRKEGVFCQKEGELLSQKTKDGYYVQIYFEPFKIRQLTFRPSKTKQPASLFHVDLKGRRLESPFYIIEWEEEGRLSKIYDKRKERSVLAKGQYGNVLEIFEDKPLNFDAWDIDLFYQEKSERVKLIKPAELVEHGALRAVIRFTYRYHNSSIWQDMIVYSDTGRIDFATRIDWQEEHRLLKAAFYTDIYVTKAVYDIQFGHVERPTHFNTGWDMAKFEVCGHKWADLSETGYGVSLFNDCKYGYSIHDNAMKLTLLKSAVYPDSQADRGEHTFTYALFPHEGGFLEGGTIEDANRFNQPASLFKNRECGEEYQLVWADSPAVQIDAVKKAEKEECLVVRMHECRGSRVCFTLHTHFPVKKAVRCNLLEEDEKENPVSEEMKIQLKPFEIGSVKLYFQAMLEAGKSFVL